jgi:hypothetical protein
MGHGAGDCLLEEVLLVASCFLYGTLVAPGAPANPASVGSTEERFSRCPRQQSRISSCQRKADSHLLTLARTTFFVSS